MNIATSLSEQEADRFCSLGVTKDTIPLHDVYRAPAALYTQDMEPHGSRTWTKQNDTQKGRVILQLQQNLKGKNLPPVPVVRYELYFKDVMNARIVPSQPFDRLGHRVYFLASSLNTNGLSYTMRKYLLEFDSEAKAMEFNGIWRALESPSTFGESTSGREERIVFRRDN